MRHRTILLAAVLTSSLAGAAPLQAENLKEEIASLKSRNESRRAEIKKIREEISATEEKAAERKAEFDRHAALTEELEKARATARDLENELRRKVGLLKHLDQHFTEQVRIPEGTSYETLKLKSGQEIKSVKYMGVNGRAIKLQHADGFASVPFEDLPPALASQIVIKPAIPVPAPLTGVFAARPKELARLKMFAEARLAESRAAIASRSESALSQIAQAREESQRVLNAEREARTQAMEQAIAANIEHNKKLDAEIARAEKLIADNESAMRAAESQFAAATAKPPKTENEIQERDELVTRHNDQMDKMRNNIGELRLRISNLLGQKKSER